MKEIKSASRDFCIALADFDVYFLPNRDKLSKKMFL